MPITGIGGAVIVYGSIFSLKNKIFTKNATETHTFTYTYSVIVHLTVNSDV